MPKKKKTENLVQRRPAETTTGLAGAVALVLNQWLNWDADTLAALIVVISAIPSLVTWWVSRSE